MTLNSLRDRCAFASYFVGNSVQNEHILLKVHSRVHVIRRIATSETNSRRYQYLRNSFALKVTNLMSLFRILIRKINRCGPPKTRLGKVTTSTSSQFRGFAHRTQLDSPDLIVVHPPSHKKPTLLVLHLTAAEGLIRNFQSGNDSIRLFEVGTGVTASSFYQSQTFAGMLLWNVTEEILCSPARNG